MAAVGLFALRYGHAFYETRKAYSSGQASWLLGDLAQIWSPERWRCLSWRAPTMISWSYSPVGGVAPVVDICDSDLPQRTCPVCSTRHDID